MTIVKPDPDTRTPEERETAPWGVASDATSWTRSFAVPFIFEQWVDPHLLAQFLAGEWYAALLTHLMPGCPRLALELDASIAKGYTRQPVKLTCSPTPKDGLPAFELSPLSFGPAKSDWPEVRGIGITRMFSGGYFEMANAVDWGGAFLKVRLDTGNSIAFSLPLPSSPRDLSDDDDSDDTYYDSDDENDD